LPPRDFKDRKRTRGVEQLKIGKDQDADRGVTALIEVS
jgi:hypothetical protein